MYAEWTKHIVHPDDKTDWKRDVKGSKRILDHLLKLLKEREASLDRFTKDTSAYDNPNWAYKRANIDGRYQELKYLSTLIDLDQQNE